MVHMNGFWACVNYVLSFLTFSPFGDPGRALQSPLLNPSDVLHHDRPLRGPKFKPPGGEVDDSFVCSYPTMTDYESCSTPEDRSCWLINPKTRDRFDIKTDYETRAPVGVLREYWLNITDSHVNTDGQDFPLAKLFNSTYPGPWIQACWGDNVTIHVTNNLQFNGTSVHWHGIRQLNTMHMDGVNGITQCPIAPKDNFTYSWRVLQYGSSWYHSHYSVQYADGATGPMSLHGPTSAPYDEAIFPIIMTDWGHNTAFNALWTGDLANETILLDGRGNVTSYNNSVKNTLPIPEPYTIHFQPSGQLGARRYLMRLINTSFRSHFIFSIDNHRLQIVGSDFVPIKPYYNESVLVGIGQRYHVIVTAKPETNGSGNPIQRDGNYWIRTNQADCFGFNHSDPKNSPSPGYERTGILRYDSKSTARPQSQPWNFSFGCSDETYDSLEPIVPWTVGNASNGLQFGENFTVQNARQNGVDGSTIYPKAFFSVGGADFNPLRIDYGNPTFLNLNYSGKWDPLWVVIPENFTADKWVYLALIGKGAKHQTTGAHPIHLHGHDFAILQQVGNTSWPVGYKPKRNNPPRRDVVLLPTDGYVVIAFKTDNPGSWLVHCHIADHAAAGLAMQILERQTAAMEIWPNLNVSHALQRAQNTCNNWNKWWGDCNNWWPGGGKSCMIGNNGFSPDSGI